MSMSALHRESTLRGFGASIVAVFLVALAAACSSSSHHSPATGSAHNSTANPVPVATTQPGVPGASAPQASIPRCHTNELAGTFTGFNSAMYHKGVTLWLTNRAAHTCYIYGYEGLGLLDSHGNLLPTHLARVAEAHSDVMMRPGGSAHASLVWSVMPDTKTAFVYPSQVEITPPDEYAHLTVPWPFGGVVGGSISTTPLSGASFPAVPTGSGTVRTAFADMCMNVPGTVNGTKVGVWECNGAASQQWTAYSDGTLRNNGKCLETAGGSTRVGANVDIGTCNGGPSQQWQISQVSQNPFGPIINAGSNNALTDPGGSTTNGTQLRMGVNRGDQSGPWRVSFHHYMGH